MSIHWLSRGAIAVVASSIFFGGTLLLLWIPLQEGLRHYLTATFEISHPFSFSVSAVVMLIPIFAIGLGIYGALTWQFGPGSAASRETLCRKCGYILRGLVDPRCPECGERI